MVVFEKIKKLSPLKTYLIGALLIVAARFFYTRDIMSIFYILSIIGFYFAIYAVVKYFSKDI